MVQENLRNNQLISHREINKKIIKNGYSVFMEYDLRRNGQNFTFMELYRNGEFTTVQII